MCWAHWTVKLLEGNREIDMTYKLSFRKSVSVTSQLGANVVNDIQCRTKGQEWAHCDDSEALLDFTSDQTDPGTRL
jgi:hypothetical protein